MIFLLFHTTMWGRTKKGDRMAKKIISHYYSATYYVDLWSWRDFYNDSQMFMATLNDYFSDM